jgi:hypothetical protein
MDHSGIARTTFSVRRRNEVGVTARRAKVDGIAEPDSVTRIFDNH